MSSVATRPEVVGSRMSSRERQLVEIAAGIANTSVSNFVRVAATIAARQAVVAGDAQHTESTAAQ